jgi:hypothetical protein
MQKFLSPLSLVALLGLAGSGAASAALSGAPAIPVNTQLAFSTSLQAMNGLLPGGALEGQLRIRVSSGGIVQGIYRPVDGGIQPVTGGITGNKIWLDLADNGGLHVTGTLKDGKIVGGALISERDYRFTATPEDPHAAPPA